MPPYDSQIERWLREAEAEALREQRPRKPPARLEVEDEDDGWDDGYFPREKPVEPRRVNPLRKAKLQPDF
jgi:hypothetical protein